MTITETMCLDSSEKGTPQGGCGQARHTRSAGRPILQASSSISYAPLHGRELTNWGGQEVNGKRTKGLPNTMQPMGAPSLRRRQRCKLVMVRLSGESIFAWGCWAEVVGKLLFERWGARKGLGANSPAHVCITQTSITASTSLHCVLAVVVTTASLSVRLRAQLPAITFLQQTTL
ncbi:hypothetical protein K469DRAFT_787470 [Zopfia rhizophila CBS 207.26]|uniref:Uncharacterized protein n=1 Tax=Zopfia rhizophila CBS 207.26 TaxID=1314779 RepID=A0A6A6DX17_9PEZI|nr:hypothetical protein K469DRAFT_787470 [Zopfia rhizophila CBS 207.26]